MQQILSGSGIKWADEKQKINSNFFEAANRYSDVSIANGVSQAIATGKNVYFPSGTYNVLSDYTFDKTVFYSDAADINLGTGVEIAFPGNQRLDAKVWA